MSIHPESAAYLAIHAEAPPDKEVMFPVRLRVQAWLQELAKSELAIDRINPRELTQRIMQDVFGRYLLPPRASGMLATSHLLHNVDSQDRQDIWQLVIAWFISMPSSAVDESTWFARQAVRRPRTPHLTLMGHAEDVAELSRYNIHDGRILLVPESDDVITRRWDPGTGGETDKPADSPLSGIPVRRETTFINVYGRTLLAVPNGNNAKITDRVTGEEVGVSLRGHSFQVTAMSSFYGPAGRPLLASASRDYTTRIWDPAFKSCPVARLIEQLNEMQVATWFVAADESPRVSITRDTYDGVLQIWGTDTGQWVGELNAHPGQLWAEARSVRFTIRQCGQMLAIAEQESLWIWDLDLRQLVGESLTGHAARISDILGRTTPFGEIRLATASSDGSIQPWDPVKGIQVGRSFTGHVGPVRVLCALNTRHGDTWLASVGDEGVIRIWDPGVGRLISRSLKGLSCLMTCVVALSAANGKPRLATTGDNYIVRIRDPGNGRQLGRLSDGGENLCDVILVGTNQEGHTRLATSGLGRSIRFWGIATGRTICAMHALDYVETIISLHYGDLAVSLDDGWTLLWLPPRVQGIIIPPGPIARLDEGFTPGLLA